MKYIFSLPSPFERFVTVEIQIGKEHTATEFQLQLPAWRPGRYELGNFAKNIRNFNVVDASGAVVAYRKLSKDLWSISPAGGPVKVTYSYFASQPDAGACWVDHDQLYINPIHCCMYIPGRENEKCEVSVNVPANWNVATGMKSIGPHQFETVDFHELVDSPFIASPSLQHGEYTVNNIKFHIWIQGECRPDWLRVIRDFEAFSNVQLKMMKTFPVSEYHFLVQILPFPFYHGVEHTTSTVLAMGPGYNFMKNEFYNDFLGVASHELFHVWNVKAIRPAEMYPYDYTKENYASTGYVYEGVTTYYGDLFLARSGYFTLDGLLEEYSVRLQKHMDNPGRFNHGVAQSSFDTWLDGYVPGVPGRKVSIYDEGCLIAWMLDFMIRSATDSSRSLDNVMQALYFDFAQKGRGYTAEDFRQLCEAAAGRNFDAFFDQYVYAPATLNGFLSEVASLAGISIEESPSPLANERLSGIRVESRGGSVFVVSVFPGSPGALAGLVKDDEILAVNKLRVENNLSDLVSYFGSSSNGYQLTIASGKKLREVHIAQSDTNWLGKFRLVSQDQLTLAQLRFRQQWLQH
jgi:predicted metalloprotease with PDZ domain